MKILMRIAGLLFFLAPCPMSGQAAPAQAVFPDPVLVIGESLGRSEAYAFTRIVAIAVIGDSILVLEGGSNEVRVFSHGGNFLGRLGRTGEGPGEFQWATQLRVVPEGLVVVDLGLRRQSFFSLKGELLRTEPLGGLVDHPLSKSVAMRGGESVAETAVRFSNDQGAFPERLLLLIGPRGGGVDTIARYSSGAVPFRADRAYGFLRTGAGAAGAWAVAGDSLLVVAAGEPPTLRWWRSRPGGSLLVAQMPLPIRSEPFTPRDLRNLIEVENTLRRADGEPTLPRSVQADAPQYWGQVKQLVVSSAHECWIQWDRPRSEEDNEWFRVSLATRALARVSLPRGFRMLAAVEDRLYGYVLNEYDTPVLKVLRVRPPRSD